MWDASYVLHMQKLPLKEFTGAEFIKLISLSDEIASSESPSKMRSYSVSKVK
jgi:hypothetical protein